MSRQLARAQLEAKLGALPDGPGLYMMKGKDGAVVYVGKAKNLRRRVRAYFQPARHDRRRRFGALVRAVADVDCVLTASEQEALVLEAIQIRSLRPRFNIALKEARCYPYIRITGESYPRMLAARTLTDDGSRYLGPFSDITAMYAALRLVMPMFGLRTCTRRLAGRHRHACLEHQLGRCCAPCLGAVGQAEYRQAVARAIRVLQGDEPQVLEDLRAQMEQAAALQRFERAGEYRDQLAALRFLQDRRKVLVDEQVDRDVIGLARAGDSAGWCVLTIRSGRLCGCQHLVGACPAGVGDTEAVLGLLMRRHAEGAPLPAQVQTAAAPPEEAALRALAAPGRAAPAWCPASVDGHMQALANLNAARILARRGPAA